MMATRRPAALCLLTIFLIAACAPRERSITLPDLSALAEPVQRQIRERFAALSQKRSNRATPTGLAEAYGELGRLLLAARLGTTAEASFLNAEVLMPRDRRWPYLLGHTYLLLGDRAKARVAFERTLSLAPNDLPATIWLAESHLDDGRPVEAEAVFLKAAALDPRSAAARFGAGRASLARQNYGGAAQQFEQALALEPEASAIHYPLAMAYRGLGDLQKTEAHLARRGEVWPALPDPLMEQQRGLLDTVTAYEQRGVDALAAGDMAGAVAAFRNGLELDPGDPALRNRLGKALYAAGDAAGAMKEFEEVVRRSPSFAEGHTSIGTLHTLRGNYKDAAAHFTTAVAANPDSLDARLGLAEALRASGQPQASLAHYDRAIQLNPAISEAWVGKALAFIALRRYPEAREWLGRARRLHPDQPKLAEIETLLPR